MRLSGVAVGLLMLAVHAWAQAGGGAPPAGTQQEVESNGPVTTLTVKSRVVEISAVVTGKNGEPMGGLTKDDFVLKEDGHDESIRYFSQGSELPLTMALLVDTSGSQRTFVGDESLASDVFFETMLERPQDRAELVEVDTRVLELQPMTASAEKLHLALNRMGADAKTANGTRLLDAIWAVSRQRLAGETGRKAMILLTDGGDNGSRTTAEGAIAEAQRNNVQIYSVRYSAWGGFSGGRGADAGAELLQRLSEATGGRVFTVAPGMSLRTIYGQIAADLRLQYELGYTPPADLQPNSYHRLEVRLKDKKLAVQARKGFFAQP